MQCFGFEGTLKIILFQHHQTGCGEKMKHHQNDQICACNNKENPLSKQKPLFKAKSLS